MVLAMALGSFMVGDDEYSPESGSGAYLATFAWTLAGIVLVVGSVGRVLNDSIGLGPQLTGPENRWLDNLGDSVRHNESLGSVPVEAATE